VQVTLVGFQDLFGCPQHAARADAMLSTLTETTTAAGVAEEVDLARDLPLHVSTFMAWTAAVAVLTTVIVKKCMSSSENAADDFFLGGRSLG
jgi:hypothetical protein